MARVSRTAATVFASLVAMASGCAPDWSPSGELEGDGRPNAESGESGDGVEYGVCGNGVHEPGESCDEDDDIWGDGCNPDCRLGGELIWRDSIVLEGEAYTVEGLERFPDGTIAVVARDQGFPYDRLTVAWREDGKPAWTRRPADYETNISWSRQSLMHEGRLFVVDRWRLTGEDSAYQYGLHLEELDTDGQLLSSLDLPLTQSNQAVPPLVYLEPTNGGLRLVSEYEEELEVRRLDFATGDWALEDLPFVLSMGQWEEVVAHAKLPDDTDLYLVRSNSSALHWLYRVGADREVTEWDIVAISGFASMRVRNQHLFMYVQPEWWDLPYVWQYDFEANFVSSWPMEVESELGTLFFENATAAWFGSEELITLGTDYRQLGRQTLAGEDRWGRGYLHGGYRPQHISMGQSVSDPFVVAGQSIDDGNTYRLFVEARSP